MSDESPTKRLSQIFGSLSCLSDIKASEAIKNETSKDSHGQCNSKPSQFNFSQNVSPSASLPSSSNNTSRLHTSNIPTSRILAGSSSTPNSPRLMPKRSRIPPAVPQRPLVNPALVALDTETPWPHFSTLTDHLDDVHQVNNYNQGLPEINWQERCLELQLELHRSKSQAGRIRDMLGDKSDDEHNSSVSDMDSQPSTPKTPYTANEDTPTKYTNDGLFKIPRDRKDSSASLNDQDYIIAKRTRSKVSLATIFFQLNKELT